MFPLLPIITFAFLFLTVSTLAKQDWRCSLLCSALLWGALLTGITEFLSIFRLLSFPWLASIWLLSCLGLSLVYYYVSRRKRLRAKNYDQAKRSDCLRLEPLGSKVAGLRVRVWIAGILFIAAFVGLIALIAPPNTNDSMGYHMPRVMHWMQNQSVAHFPTNYTAQLFLSPWSAFAILHFQILSGSDRYANLVQWFSMVGGIIGVSIIAKQLGANPYGQAFASVFCATIPLGILQGSSTQNDYVVAFWLICLVYYILLSVQNQEGKGYYWQIGISLALATFSKPTAYVYAFPFLIWLFVNKVRLLHWQLWKPICQVAILVAVMNGLHWIRNLEVFHDPLGKSPDYIVYTNRAINLPLLLSNIVRNFALHFSTPSPSINQLLVNGLSFVHTLLGLDINDPRITAGNFQLNSLINHEDLAANTIHLLLIGIAIAVLCLNWRKRIFHSSLIIYFLCIITGFLIFCLLLAWTPFHTRLHLPLFILSSAFVACVLSKAWSLKIVNFVAIGLLIASLPWVFFNETRPLIGNGNFIKTGKVENIFNTSRAELYFMGRRYYKEPMIGAAKEIHSQQCSKIGITFDKLDIFEYPLWALLQSDRAQNYQIQHVGVDNVSKVKQQELPFKDFNPCIIFDAGGDIFEKVPKLQNKYTQAWFKTPVRIFIKTED